MPLGKTRLFDHLEGAERILVAGAGGGCDIYCGLPLYFALRQRGADVHLGNLSFADLSRSEPLGRALRLVRADDDGGEYAPELQLARWLAGRGISAGVYAFERVGVRPLADGYRALAERLGLDAVVLVDGGTDALMRGDEFNLATPEEDIASILAVAELRVQRKALVCTAFGVDAYHGICHAQFLENVSHYMKRGGYLGVFSMDAELPEVRAYVDAVRHLGERQSIVNTSVVSAIEGFYGDHHSSPRTAGTKLWINPLMALCWAFELDAVAERVLYRDAILHTRTYEELTAAIRRFRARIYERRRPFEAIPA